MTSTTIRPARTNDPAEVDRLYDVCLRTGDGGADATTLYSDPRLLGEIYLGAYLALEPDLAFVVARPGSDDGGSGTGGSGAGHTPDDGGSPAPEHGALGYVVGTTDTAAFEARCEREWWPALRARYPVGSFAEGSRDEQLVRMIHTPPVTSPAIAAEYPAHLHVDLLPAAQGGGNGRRLLETLFDALRERHVPGLHLGVASGNTGAIGFYRHLGFTELSAAPGVLMLGLRL